MKSFNAIAALSALLALLALQACAPMTPSEDLELHGSCGKGFQYFGRGLGIALDVACLPVTVFFNGKLDPAFGDYGYVAYPGYGAEAVFYHLGAGLAYPVYLCSLPFDGSSPPSGPPEARLGHFIARLPHLDEDEYKELLSLSRRAYAPAYLPAAHCYSFGWRDSIDRDIASEWRYWSGNGSPAGGLAEQKAIVRYWIFKAGDDAEGRPRWLFARDLLCKAASVSEDDVYKFWKDSGNAARYGSSSAEWRYWVQMHGGLDGLFKEKGPDR